MKLVAILVFIFSLLEQIFAIDEVRLQHKNNTNDNRDDYAEIIIKRALELTKTEYGEYRISYFGMVILRGRALSLLQNGEELNVYKAPSQPNWEKKLIPIYIPIEKGLLSYRLLFIHKDNRNMFTKNTTTDDMKRYRVGLGEQWSTTKMMRASNFTIITGTSYEGLFKMLMIKRYDYFPRGLDEVFMEYDRKTEEYPDLHIDENLLIYLPTPNFIFVSPKYPRIAERLEKGIRIMIESGEFDTIFNDYYLEDIKRANLGSRKFLQFVNPLLSDKAPPLESDMWYKP